MYPPSFHFGPVLEPNYSILIVIFVGELFRFESEIEIFRLKRKIDMQLQSALKIYVSASKPYIRCKILRFASSYVNVAFRDLINFSF